MTSGWSAIRGLVSGAEEVSRREFCGADFAMAIFPELIHSERLARCKMGGLSYISEISFGPNFDVDSQVGSFAALQLKIKVT